MIPGGIEWIVLLFLIILLFGTKKIPKLARSAGKAQAEFQRGREETDPDESTDLTTQNSTK